MAMPSPFRRPALFFISERPRCPSTTATMEAIIGKIVRPSIPEIRLPSALPAVGASGEGWYGICLVTCAASAVTSAVGASDKAVPGDVGVADAGVACPQTRQKLAPSVSGDPHLLQNILVSRE